MTLVLDANVLEHMLNPAVNQGGFITEMVRRILDKKWKLGLDEREQIDREYFRRLGQCLRNANAPDTIARQLLGMFVNTSAKVPYPHVQRQAVDKTDILMQCIKRQMPDKREAGYDVSLDKDRVYVYVAAKLDGVLITSDDEDIRSVAVELKKCAKTHARTNFEILDPHSAKAWLDQQ